MELPRSQYGFWYEHSAEQQTLGLRKFRTSNLNQTLKTASLLTKVYDGIWQSRLIHKINQLGYLLNDIHMVGSFLADLQIQIGTRYEYSRYKRLEATIPQSTVLSPLLFNIYIEDMPVPEYKNFIVLQFADAI